jgi:hypothetical protein
VSTLLGRAFALWALARAWRQRRPGWVRIEMPAISWNSPAGESRVTFAQAPALADWIDADWMKVWREADRHLLAETVISAGPVHRHVVGRP